MKKVKESKTVIGNKSQLVNKTSKEVPVVPQK